MSSMWGHFLLTYMETQGHHSFQKSPFLPRTFYGKINFYKIKSSHSLQTFKTGLSDKSLVFAKGQRFGHDSSAGEWMYLMVCPLHSLGSISSVAVVEYFKRFFPDWSFSANPSWASVAENGWISPRWHHISCGHQERRSMANQRQTKAEKIIMVYISIISGWWCLYRFHGDTYSELPKVFHQGRSKSSSLHGTRSGVSWLV